MSVVGVLFDVGNVIVRWDPARLYEKIFTDPVERSRFLTEVCTMAWHTRHDAGVTMADNGRDLIAAYPHYKDAIEAWNLRWDEMFDGCIAQTIDALEALHAHGIPLFALTNMPSEKAAGVFAMDRAFGHFQDIVVSGDEGMVKPDPRIYQRACERSGLEPHQLLFIDDSAANIAAAKALGFAVHRFDDPADLHPALVAHGLL